MEKTSSENLIKPPRYLEATVEKLLPYSYRDVALKELANRYVSPGHYIDDATCWIRMVFPSQIRRSFRLGFLLTQACAVSLVFIALPVSLPMILYLLVALAGWLICDGYNHPAKGTQREAVVDGCRVVAVCLWATPLMQLGFELKVPLNQLITAASIGLVLVSIVRTLFRRMLWLKMRPMKPGDPLRVEYGTTRTRNLLWGTAGCSSLVLINSLLPSLIPYQSILVITVPVVAFALNIRLQWPDLFPPGAPNTKDRILRDPQVDEVVEDRANLYKPRTPAARALETMAVAFAGLPFLLVVMDVGRVSSWLPVVISFTLFVALLILGIWLRKINQRTADLLERDAKTEGARKI